MKSATRILAVLCLAGSGLPALRAQTAARPSPAPAPAPSPSPNLQLLQGLSKLELQRTMNLMRASLGVHCDYCHVVTEAEGWQWARDDKETKRTARRMIRMVMAINRESFDGRAVVSCNTCHRGSTKPLLTASLPQTPPSFPTPVVDHSGDRTAQAVLARYVSAVGGEAAARRLSEARTIRLRGTRESWDGTTAPFELAQAGPRVAVTVMTAKGEVRQVFDGSGGWTRDASGTHDLTPPEVESLRSLVRAFRPFSPADVGPGATVEGKARVGEREAWVVAHEPDDHTHVRLFFDALSGLLMRRLEERDGPVGRIPEQLDLSDYRPVDGTTVPMVQRLSLVDPWVGSTRRLELVAIDAPVDEAVFRR
jgi:photosynthetic reaction center cytochrome c subunit